jgi:hypothetical protein
VSRPVADRRVATLAAVALLALAGCGGTVPGSDGAGSTPTLTPVDVPAARAADAPVVAPGLSERRVYDAATFLGAYRAAAATERVAIRRTRTIYPAGAAPAPGSFPRDDRPGTPTQPPRTGTGPATTAGAGPAGGGTLADPANGTATPAATVPGTVLDPTGTATPAPTPRPELGPNGSYNRVLVRSTVVAPDRSYAVSRIETAAPGYRGAEPFSRIDVWFHDGAVRNRLVSSQGSRYWGQNDVSHDGPVADPTRGEYVVGDLSAFRLRVVGERRVEGERRSRLVATGFRPGQLETPPLLTDLRNGSLRAVVDGDGLVRRYRLAYDARLGDRPVRVVKTHAVVATGTDRLPRPAWLDAADARVGDRPDRVAVPRVAPGVRGGR